MSHTVIGIFDRAAQGQQAVEKLVESGFTRSQIDFSPRNPDLTDASSSFKEEEEDSIVRFFRSIFGGGEESNRYTHVSRRSSLVTVHTQSAAEAERAADILDHNGAVDVNERSQQYAYTQRDTAASSGTSEKVIPIIEEALEVGKQIVETGGVRLRSRIIERPVEAHLRLKVERVYVERHVVNRLATEADLANFKDTTLEMFAHEEVPVVAKEARVVEEVRVEKEVEEHQETIRDTVRKTDVEVEQISSEQQLERERHIDDQADLDDELSRPSNR